MATFEALNGIYKYNPKAIRMNDVTYVNSYDDFNYHMDREQFKRWFKSIGTPTFQFAYNHDSNDVWNDASKTLQKHVNYQFFITTPNGARCLVMKKHIRDNDIVEQELKAKYTRWATQAQKEI